MTQAHQYKPGSRLRAKGDPAGTVFVVYAITCRAYILVPIVEGEVKWKAPRKAVGFAAAHHRYEEV